MTTVSLAPARRKGRTAPKHTNIDGGPLDGIEGIWEVLYALAEVRDGPFYALWADLADCAEHGPLPEIGSRVYRGDGGDAPTLSVWVSAVRGDGREVVWSVGLTAAPRSLTVTASVEVLDSRLGGRREIHWRSEAGADPGRVPSLLRSLSQTVCAERRWITD